MSAAADNGTTAEGAHPAENPTAAAEGIHGGVASALAPPPIGEEIHLPGPSLLPLATTIGLTLALVGVTLSWLCTAAGCLITAVCAVRWISASNAEIDELPLTEHHS